MRSDLNRYRYVGNDPVNSVDPSGLWTVGDCGCRNHFYTRERWRKYFLSLPTNKDSSNYLLYGRFICRTWNEHPASPDKRLKTFKIVFHSQLTRPDGSKNPKITQNVWEHRCYDDKDD